MDRTTYFGNIVASGETKEGNWQSFRAVLWLALISSKCPFMCFQSDMRVSIPWLLIIHVMNTPMYLQEKNRRVQRLFTLEVNLLYWLIHYEWLAWTLGFFYAGRGMPSLRQILRVNRAIVLQDVWCVPKWVFWILKCVHLSYFLWYVEPWSKDKNYYTTLKINTNKQKSQKDAEPYTRFA